MRGRSPGGMPPPVSCTTISTAPPSRRVDTVTVPPSGMASRAFRSRFRKTARSWASSPRTGGRPGASSRRTSIRAAASSGAKKSSRLPRRPREAQVLLGDAVQSVHLARDGLHELDGLLARRTAREELLLEQLRVEADGVQGVPDLVGDLGGDAADGGEALGPPQLVALVIERRRHGVE